MTRWIPALAALLLALPLAAQAGSARKRTRTPQVKAPALVTTASGLKHADTKVGTGATPQRGQRCLVHYTGWLSDHGQKQR